jgi:hypothetical protein
MRTTITLPDEILAAVRVVAQQRQQSVSSLIAQFTVRGLRQLGQGAEIAADPMTGLPTIVIGRPIGAAEAIAE